MLRASAIFEFSPSVADLLFSTGLRIFFNCAELLHTDSNCLTTLSSYKTRTFQKQFMDKNYYICGTSIALMICTVKR